MAADPLFIDSGGFYALISDGGPHNKAAAVMEAARHSRRRALTTDYIIDETATLLRARGLTRQLKEFFRLVEQSQALSMEWMNPDRFAAARKLFP